MQVVDFETVARVVEDLYWFVCFPADLFLTVLMQM